MKSFELDADDKRVLQYIQRGFNIMSELVDITGMPGERLNAIIEKMDIGRFIERESLISLGFWKFNLTAKGEAQLPVLDNQDRELHKYSMYGIDQQVLKVTNKDGKVRAVDVVEKLSGEKNQTLEIAVSIVKLIRLGYLKESGLLRRYIEITAQGADVLSKTA